MKLEFDPVWPWSELRQFLADSPDPVVPLLVWGTGLLALALPPLLLWITSRRQQRQLLFTFGLWFVVQLLWVARTGSPTSGIGLAEQARNASLTLLLIVPLGLLGWMLRTYLLAPALTRRRFLSILALRLGAVACALTAVTRPYLGFPDITRTGAAILILIDDSESMTIQDESGQSRWERMLRALRECEPLIALLRNEQGIEVEFYRFARDAGRWQLDSPGKPDGQRTDIGNALRWLYDNCDRRPLKGLFILSDGRNNGIQQISAVTEARRWRKLGCPVHTVLLGSPNTPNGQRDVAVTRVTPSSSMVQVKSEMTAIARIDAPGFEDFNAKVRVFLERDGKREEVNDAKIETLQGRGEEQNYAPSENGVVKLRDTRNNEVRIRLTAPKDKGEYKLTVRVENANPPPGQPFPGELNADNNEASTLISVIPGGISVLLIDRPRAGEPQLLFDVLKSDPRMRPRAVWLGNAGPLDRGSADSLFQFEKEKYDVIILGDVRAEQLRAVNPKALTEIARLVDEGAGLVMLGGYSTFGNGDWKGTALEPLLPVDLSFKGQEEDQPFKMTPTEPGLRLYGYVLGLANGQKANELAAWEQLPPLDGMMKIKPRGGALDNVLAESKKGDALLVSQPYGKGRVLAFAGDSTYRWTGTPEGRLKHSRFWRQMTVWLAQQEKADGNVWAKPDVRDVPVGTPLGFSVGVRGKGGIDLPDGVYEVDVLLPNKQLKRVSTVRSGTEERGVFRPEMAGEYVIKVKGTARDPAGGEVSGTAEARFLAHEEDVEMAEWSADKGFMDKLAKEGRGKAATASELPGLLKDLLAPSALDGKPRLIPWPDWRSTQRSGFLPLFLLIFVALLTGEWFLRRRWGMV